jgi:hypothetical protein
VEVDVGGFWDSGSIFCKMSEAKCCPGDIKRLPHIGLELFWKHRGQYPKTSKIFKEQPEGVWQAIFMRQVGRLMEAIK